MIQSKGCLPFVSVLARSSVFAWAVALALVGACFVSVGAAGVAAESVRPRVEGVVSGLEAPWALDFTPDGRILITERPGRIRVVEDGRLRAEPWLELDVHAVGEGGLMGLAVDPDFAANGYVYVAYTASGPRGPVNRLVRLREDRSTGRGTVDRVLFDGVRGGTVHNGGRVKVGPDGLLYWTTGDAGNAASAQDATSLSGAILRLNRDGSIPADNPFPRSPVYSYGHRNPQGLAWHPVTGELYSTEHGPSGSFCCRDELNRIEPGRNYGWPVITGNERRAGMVTPLVTSGPDRTWAPAGAAFVSAGPWAGSLVFAGLRGQALYRVIFEDGSPDRVRAVEEWFKGEFGRLRDAVEGPDGALYVLTSNRDGRGARWGRLSPGDDKLLRVSFSE